VQPSPLSHVGPSSAVHAAAATLGLVVSKPDVSRAAGRPCALPPEPRHGTRPTGDSRAVGSKEKGGRMWN
jgi:hypothetical protein